jgi:xylulokinase
VTDLIALGGGSRSRVWCQLIADIMRRRIDVVREPESTCLGSGMLAAPPPACTNRSLPPRRR